MKAARRVGALGLGLVLAALLAAGALWAWGWPGRAHSISVEGNLAEIDAFLAERALEGPTPLPPGPGPHLVREPIPESIAVQLFPQLALSGRAIVYDPYCYYRSKPKLERRVLFGVRPEGQWMYRTNAMGLRMDREIRAERPDLRILAIGDSQTEGICSNVETWPSRLEQGIDRRHPGREIEVINTGKAGYHFYNYLGALEKYLDLEPHVVVIGMYSGNDFAESLILHHYFRRTERVSCTECDEDAMRRLRSDITMGYHTQALRQVRTFRHHPEELAPAREAAFSVIAECARICRERGIELVLMHIPTMVDAQPELLEETLDDALLLYRLEREDLAISTELADEVLDFAAEHGVATLDLLQYFKGVDDRKLYWDRDQHLSVEGNHAVGALLTAKVLELLLER